MNRRGFLAGAASALEGVASSRRGRAATAPADIIVLLTDDMAEGDLRVMEKTARLVARTVFPAFVYPTPLCGPARATLLTGEYAHNHGVRDNERAWPVFKRRGRRTLCAAMAAAGYHVGWTGKFMNGYLAGAIPGVADNRAGEFTSYRSDKGYLTDIMGKQAVNVIANAPASKPLFLTVGFKAPHSPWEVARKYAHANVGSTRNSVDASRKRMLLSVDDAIATIVAAQQKRNRPTCYFFLSDNGYLTGQHGVYGKAAWWQEASVVPLWANCEGIAAGTDPRLAATIDIAPTLLTIAGVDLSPRSLGWTIDGRPLQEQWDRTLLGVENWDRSAEDIHGHRAANTAFHGLRGKETLYIEHGGKPRLYTRGDESRTAPLGGAERTAFSARLRDMMTCRGEQCRTFDQTV